MTARLLTSVGIHFHWWPSVGGGKDGAKQKFDQEKYARHDADKGDRVYCILTDKEPVRTFACRELTSQNGGKYEKLYDCRKPVKHYYIYFLLSPGSRGAGQCPEKQIISILRQSRGFSQEK